MIGLLQPNLTFYKNSTSIPQLYTSNECAFFYYNNVALILWVTASVFCFLALISTIITIFCSYQIWAQVQDLENAIIDLIDESCQILLPLGICKQICHPHHIGNVNANYGQKGQKQEQKPGAKENRYPEDVTFPPSDIEKVYDVMGDEDLRKSKTMYLFSVKESQQDKKKKEKEKKEKEKERERELKKVGSWESLLQETQAPQPGSRETSEEKKGKLSSEPADNRTPTLSVPKTAKDSAPSKTSKDSVPKTARESLSKGTPLKKTSKKTSAETTTTSAATPKNPSKESGRKPPERSPNTQNP